MQRLIEQRYSVKFCVKLGKNGPETFQMLQQAYKEDAMSRAMVFVCNKRFKEGREDVEDDDRSGRPSTSRNDDNLAKVREVLNSDRRLSIRLIADRVNLNYGTVFQMVTEDLAMRKICAKLVPKVLTDDQKQRRMAVAQEMLERLQAEPNFLDKVVTGDETWVFEYDPETKRQSSEWHTTQSPKPKKARMTKSRVKSMLIAFFDAKGMIHKEFVPAGQTVNGQYYAGVIRRLKDRVHRVRPEKKNDWVLHHDNAPVHTCLTVTEVLARNNVATLPQPPYSPDVAPSDFFLFPRMMKDLKGKRFGTVQAVEAASTRVLNNIPVEEFQKAFEQWKTRWQRCVDSEGAYFEDF
ncbi:histone-lysine N-methyltransferase SETMAR-like [Ischnura elegans]|uniref:histone-lysine N-methyltransferase SETMAR-like n=1 Tax=Ischnura elegans TaxID=197161 RepID=UPI001ED8B1A5|nr:histone-lysine N-methyltransferase SETMAR-like [Ischnura elegans]